MLDLTFGEQVKIILSRKGMTIKELAENIEEHTGKKMSRQNLTQRLGRDNFQEQDMRMIAKILGCSFHLTILEDDVPTEKEENTYHIEKTKKEVSGHTEKKSPVSKAALERDITIGELVDLYEGEPDESSKENVREEDQRVSTEEVQETYAEEQNETYAEEAQEIYEEEPQIDVEEVLEEIAVIEEEAKEEPDQQKPVTDTESEEEKKEHGWRAYFKRRRKPESQKKAEAIEESVQGEGVHEEETYEETGVASEHGDVNEQEVYETYMEPLEEAPAPEEEEDLTKGERNPYTGREYESNSVRMHPTRIGYVQVYDRENHQWTDMTEWAFLGYQERKKVLLGKDYEPPIYLD